MGGARRSCKRGTGRHLARRIAREGCVRPDTRMARVLKSCKKCWCLSYLIRQLQNCNCIQIHENNVFSAFLDLWLDCLHIGLQEHSADLFSIGHLAWLPIVCNDDLASDALVS